MRGIALLLLVLLGGLGIACGTPEPPATPRRSAPADGAFCAEHGVLEALCTKCNAALIPVFQAKGDWCAEHGFPMSICPVHHPEREGRPQVDVADDDAPAEGTKVRFKTKETARLAGLRTAVAVARPVTTTIAAPARIVYDASRVAHLNARAPGVVRSMLVDVGSRVGRGTPLAVIESASVGADASILRSARTRVEVAEADFDRARRLHDEGITPQRDLLVARREVEEARAALSAVEAALGVVGPTDEGSGRYSLTSPIQGVVTLRDATVGEVVQVEDRLFEIVDTSVMWAEIDVPEAGLPDVAPGQRVALSIEGFGDRQLVGELAYIAPEIDPRTRTAKARVSLDNPGGLLRANVFGEAHIAVSRSETPVLVPAAAVQRARSVEVVFVRLAEDLYEARRVRRGATEGELIEIVGSVRPGDEVVTEGSFFLKTETLRGSIGAGCCEVD